MSDTRTDLVELVGVPPRLDFEDEVEYRERIVFEYADDIKDAVLYDVAMGHVDWKKSDMPIDDFCTGWVDVYIGNLIAGLGFDGIPVSI